MEIWKDVEEDLEQKCERMMSHTQMKENMLNLIRRLCMRDTTAKGSR